MVDENDDLGIIELDDALEDAEKPPELPPGLYTAEVQDVQKATSGKGNQYFAIRCVVPPDEIGADLRDNFPDGATLSWNRQVVPKAGDRRALFSLRKLIEAMGLPTNTTTIDPNEWMGRSVRIKVRHKPYEGEMRAEIQSIESAEAPSRGNGAKRTGKAAKDEEEVDDDDRATPARGGRGSGAKPKASARAR